MKQQQRQLLLLLLAYAAQRDVDPDRLCRLAGLDRQRLSPGRELKASPEQVNRLWENAAALSGDPLFGLHFGASSQLAALGVVGALIGTSDTVGAAVSQVCTMTGLFTSLFTIDAELNTKHFTMHFRPAAGVDSAAPAFRHMIDFFMAFAVHELDGLLWTKVIPDAVYTVHSATLEPALEQVFRCRPLLRKDKYALRFPRALWDERILTADYEMQALHLQQVQALLGQKPGLGEFGTKVYAFLMANAYLGLLSLEALAAGFNLSGRSLQRRLKNEGTGYQEIADQVRRSLAESYLGAGTYPIKEISGLLGYNEVSAFTRAFKKWTGTTPAGYRN
ncbi:AraC family transcriptional regulator [Taibaiella chishuiensis]|uniref:AraC family transcriptional regulator n=1 Tax=Taibaiella chishuiensis TaxID=1434707 RepID=UPI000D0DDE26|nr:AraC family transcriptional regulator [Taibaiella chishuiensis]